MNEKAREAQYKLWISVISNVGAAINFSSIEVALIVMNNSESEDIENSKWIMSVLDSLVFLGCILGMLFFGYVGDAHSRLRGMRTTLSLAIGGIFIALLPMSSPRVLESTLMASRFVVGVGTGGIYPLSAAIAYERDTSIKKASSQQQSELSVALANFGQPLGLLILYIVAVALLETSLTSAAKWRCVLILGFLPYAIAALLTLLLDDDTIHRKEFKISEKPGHYSTLSADDDDENTLFAACRQKPTFMTDQPAPASNVSLFYLVKKEYSTRRAMAGAGVTWFVFNAYAYGITTYYPQLAASILGDRPLSILMANVVAALAALIAAGLSLFVIRSQGARASIIYGGTLGALYCLCVCLLHVFFDIGRYYHRSLFLTLFILLRGFVQFPGIGVFCLPSILFETRVRSRAMGLASAVGKIGAVLGTAAYPAILRSLGLGAILIITTLLFAVDAALCAVLTDRPTATHKDQSALQKPTTSTASSLAAYYLEDEADPLISIMTSS